ncbi:hypothetical protein D4764_16G0000530 [Takifugu flavidus]|uniref:Uncharacterized protein n=1 Tax=Takifugu flavidus TaxID=433684 RepID=A0A5C6NX08_9TELE|nr:hypothetical protein D4764_16G0000530 [Takifugu flavidus]
MESKAEGKRSECVRVTEVSGENENVEMVVEVTGESGGGGEGEMRDMGQTGEQGVAVGEVGQEKGERGAPGELAGELGEGGMSTGRNLEQDQTLLLMVDWAERGEGGRTGPPLEALRSTAEGGRPDYVVVHFIPGRDKWSQFCQQMWKKGSEKPQKMEGAKDVRVKY